MFRIVVDGLPELRFRQPQPNIERVTRPEPQLGLLYFLLEALSIAVGLLQPRKKCFQVYRRHEDGATPVVDRPILDSEGLAAIVRRRDLPDLRSSLLQFFEFTDGEGGWIVQFLFDALF